MIFEGSELLTLGIETSCDETAVCLFKNGKILSESIASSAEIHATYGGVIPEIASRRHLEALLPCLEDAIKNAKVKMRDIQLISATGGPGLLGSVLVGTTFAKSLALALDKPLIFVDHVLAHAFAGQFGRKKLTFPFLGLVVSGGHSVFIHWKSITRAEIIGRTIDDAAGEVFDKVSSMLGWSYPGGPFVDKNAKGIISDRKRFPKPMVNKDHHDFSFSGLKTAVYYEVKKLSESKPLSENQKNQIAADFQEAICETIYQKTKKAILQTKVKYVVVGGGVSANSLLRSKLTVLGIELGCEVSFPDASLCTDNASMIAFLGAELYRHMKIKGVSKSFQAKMLQFAPYSNLFSNLNPPGIPLRIKFNV